jgi:metal-responsive CopG/Arc/MetJ family transcriptional regulator
MKVKTSITLSEDLIRSINELIIAQDENRSEFIENIIRLYIEKIKLTKRNLKDLNILNKNADILNKEAEDVLSYQVDL